MITTLRRGAHKLLVSAPVCAARFSFTNTGDVTERGFIGGKGPFFDLERPTDTLPTLQPITSFATDPQNHGPILFGVRNPRRRSIRLVRCEVSVGHIQQLAKLVCISCNLNTLGSISFSLFPLVARTVIHSKDMITLV